MAGSNDVIVWMDMEMTGLDPAKERIIEVATIITTAQLDEIASGPEIVVHQDDAVLAAMDDWNRKHHGSSGLIDRVKASTTSDADAEAQIIELINSKCSAKERPVLAGNSIHQDRRFIRRYMPKLDARLHYRMIDVSTIKELARRWFPGIIAKQPLKNDTHRALDDVRESVAELRWYRSNIFVQAPAPAVAGGSAGPATA